MCLLACLLACLPRDFFSSLQLLVLQYLGEDYIVKPKNIYSFIYFGSDPGRILRYHSAQPLFFLDENRKITPSTYGDCRVREKVLIINPRWFNNMQKYEKLLQECAASIILCSKTICSVVFDITTETPKTKLNIHKWFAKFAKFLFENWYNILIINERDVINASDSELIIKNNKDLAYFCLSILT